MMLEEHEKISIMLNALNELKINKLQKPYFRKYTF